MLHLSFVGYHDGKRYICDQCSVEYASMSSLRKHTETVHGKVGDGTGIDGSGVPGSKPAEVPQSYKCRECNTEFNNTRYYIIHYRKVHKCLPEEFKDRKQFMCDQCPDVFLSEHNLR